MTLQPFLFWKVNLLLSTPNLPLHIFNPVDLHSSNIRRPKLFGTFRSSDNLSVYIVYKVYIIL